MKNIIVFFIAILVMASCNKKSAVEEPVDKWNGYDRFLKCGEKTQNLKDKNNNVVGTVKSGIDNDANFYVKYDCGSSGKQLSKTNMFAGDKKNMPLSKYNDPKEDHFPKSTNHNEGDCSYTYKIPLTQLPHCDEPGFVYSAHCRVKDSYGNEHDAWADCGQKFHDNDCGSYDDDYNLPENKFTILYGTSYNNDSLKLYLINVTKGTQTLILQEYVGNTAGNYDGAAYDTESGMLFFTKVNTNELWVNLLTDDAPSYLAGTLTGEATSATFYNDMFYYVDTNTNIIYGVTFNANWTMASQTVLSTIPSSVAINDIAMSPAGDKLYMVGEVGTGGTELITWQITTNTYYSTALAINYGGAQIAYGSDGILYAIAPIVDGGSSSSVFTLNPDTGILTEIEEGGVIILPEPFTDISTGPIM